MEFTVENIALIKRTVAKDVSDEDLEMFIYACKRTGLDPLMRQIHLVARGTGDKRKAVIQTGIDGYRLIAARTGEYAGNDAAQFLQLTADTPTEATITVWRMVSGVRCPFTATARWFEYAPDGKGDFMWQKMPFTMLGKVAEALALRKAFPAELSGVYAEEEMAQTENAPRPIAAIPHRTVTRVEQSTPVQDAPRGFCPDHPARPFTERDGRDGKWWACGTKTGEKDGKATWCQRRPAEAPAGDRITPEQVKAIYAAGAKADCNEVRVKAQVAARFKRLPEELTNIEGLQVIAGYEGLAQKRHAEVPLDNDAKG
ncbi:MAG: phage recombination protein Bet [Sulfuricaulis sp.]|nr:phage recombination protein Bet [Sulfuricaulis sp.]